MLHLNFSEVKALVVGDAMLDCYYSGITNRISPEAPVPVLAVNRIEYVPGGSANVAMNLAKLGAKATLISQVGKDQQAKILKDKLEQNGVACDFLENNGPTIVKSRLVARQQQLMRFDFESNQSVDFQSLLSKYKSHLDDCNVVIISDYAKGMLTQDTHQLINLAREKNIEVLVDPKSYNFNQYKKASLITPNLMEFQSAYHFYIASLSISNPSVLPEKTLQAQALQMIKAYDLDGILITKSSEGMSLVLKNGKVHNQPTKAVSVYDVTGAGDTVIATFACALTAGLDYAASMQIANTAAGIVVGKSGTAFADVFEIKQKLIESSEFFNDPVDENQLVSVTQILKACNQKIVLTNGCFDLLHTGHLDYLQKAKSLGDCLVVLINDDESVKRLKGKDRPINSLKQRIKMLKGLSCVDWVCAFSEDTPIDLIKKIAPDILVKGSDYAIDDIVGAKEVLAKGGEVKTINFTINISTTELIDKIKKL